MSEAEAAESMYELKNKVLAHSRVDDFAEWQDVV